MADIYDYVQIIMDDDWGLVGIVPPTGSDKIKQLTDMTSSVYKPKGSSHEAMIVNKKRDHIITKPEDLLMITPNGSFTSSTFQPTKQNESLTLVAGTDKLQRSRVNHEETNYSLSAISDVNTLRKDNVLVGFRY